MTANEKKTLEMMFLIACLHYFFIFALEYHGHIEKLRFAS